MIFAFWLRPFGVLDLYSANSLQQQEKEA
jgi:hypothetical protein